MVALGGGFADPDMAGFQIWTCSPAICYSSFQVSTGTFDVTLCVARRSATLTKLGCWISAGSAGPLAGDVNGLAIYSVDAEGNGHLIGQTVDMSTMFETTGFKEAALTEPVQITAGDAYYLAFLSANTTEPSLMGIITGNGTAMVPVNGLLVSAYILAQAAWPASFTQAQLSGDTGTCFQTAR